MRTRAPLQEGYNFPHPFPAIVLGGESLNTVIGASSIQTEALPAGTSVIRFFSDVDCFVAYGDDPVADEDAMFFPGGIVEYFGADTGKKIAVIRATSDNGTLYITPGGR